MKQCKVELSAFVAIACCLFLALQSSKHSHCEGQKPQSQRGTSWPWTGSAFHIVGGEHFLSLDRQFCQKLLCVGRHGSQFGRQRGKNRAGRSYKCQTAAATSERQLTIV